MGETLTRFAKSCCQNTPLLWPACREPAYCPGCCQMLYQQLTSLHGELFLSFTKKCSFSKKTHLQLAFLIKKYSITKLAKSWTVEVERAFQVTQFTCLPVHDCALQFLFLFLFFKFNFYLIFTLCLLPFCAMYKWKQDLSVQSKNLVEKGSHLQTWLVLFISVTIKT